MDPRMDAVSCKSASRGAAINNAKSPVASSSESGSSSENNQPNPSVSNDSSSKRNFGFLGIGPKRQPSAQTT
ncbi:hypothetical protein FB639_006166, partial [Coemansia asiatica]